MLALIKAETGTRGSWLWSTVTRIHLPLRTWQLWLEGYLVWARLSEARCVYWEGSEKGWDCRCQLNDSPEREEEPVIKSKRDASDLAIRMPPPCLCIYPGTQDGIGHSLGGLWLWCPNVTTLKSVPPQSPFSVFFILFCFCFAVLRTKQVLYHWATLPAHSSQSNLWLVWIGMVLIDSCI